MEQFDASNINAHEAKILLGANELLKESWLIYKKNYLRFIRIIIFIIIIPTILTAFICNFIVVYYFSNFNPSGWIQVILALIVLFSIVIISNLVNSLGTLTLYYAIVNSENNLSISKIFNISLKRVIPFFILSIIEGFIIAGSFYLFIFPMVVFFVCFIFSTFIFINEEEGPLNSLYKSYEYVRGYWLDVFFRLLFIYGIGVVVLFISIVIMIFIPFFIFVLLLIAGLIYAPIITIYSYQMYKNLKDVNPISKIITKSSKYKVLGFITAIAAVGYIFLIILMTNPITRDFMRNLRGTQDRYKEATNNTINNPNTQPELTIAPIPSSTPAPTLPPFIKISDVWTNGTETYTNPRFDITFSYPSYFIVKEETENKGKYRVSFSDPYTPWTIPENSYTTSLDKNNTPHKCNNSMDVNVTEIDNPQRLPLTSFFWQSAVGYAGQPLAITTTPPPQSTPNVFYFYDKSALKPYSIPKSGSYLEISGSEFPDDTIRNVYFSSGTHVYEFSAENKECNLGEQLSDDELALFANILQSITFIPQTTPADK